MTSDIETLARPVRHEANNLLAALGGTLDLMLRSATDERDLARVERMRDATRRLEALFKAYLSLASPPPDQAEGTDAPQVLTLLQPLLTLLLGPGRSIEVAAPARLRRTAMPAADLQALILRLAREAAAAAPPQGGLRVTMDAAPGGIILRAAPTPEGAAPPPAFLPAAP
jgi:signal transduction histidine kinase